MSEQSCIDVNGLREAIKKEYEEVALNPEKGFHFHTGRMLAHTLEYHEQWLQLIPEENLRSFAGVGNPFLLWKAEKGETVLDLGCGAGLDLLIAAHMIGSGGRAIGIDMTPAMLDKTLRGAKLVGLTNLEVRAGLLEELPLPDTCVDLIISNGVINLCPDKYKVWREALRVLKPTGRVQVADIVVDRPIPDSAKSRIDLWTG